MGGSDGREVGDGFGLGLGRSWTDGVGVMTMEVVRVVWMGRGLGGWVGGLWLVGWFGDAWMDGVPILSI